MRRWIVHLICATLTLCEASLSRGGKDYRKLVRTPGSEFVPGENKGLNLSGEPTCEELRAMWRFSRRQSRAAEITNDIPTYRDPFAYNIWETYARPRSMIGNSRPAARGWARPVYGKIVQTVPTWVHLNRDGSSRAYEEVLRHFGNTDSETRRKQHTGTLRLSGGSLGQNRLSQTGSFQDLKKIIWAERAKELQQQRMLEEAAARSAALKDVQVPSHYRGYPEQAQSNLYAYDPDSSKAVGRIAHYEPGVPLLNQDYIPGYRRPLRQRSMYDYEDGLGEVSW